MRKTLIVIVLMSLLIFSMSVISYGDTTVFDNHIANQKDGEDVRNALTQKESEDMIYDGSTTVAGQKRYTQNTEHGGESTSTILARIAALPPNITYNVMTDASRNEWQETKGEKAIFGFSVERAVFNNIDLLDVNYYRPNDNIYNMRIKESILSGYEKVTKNLAITISLGTLIYMGIRMGISTIASDKAKYKRMLMDWVISFVLIFVMSFIIETLLGISSELTEGIAGLANDKNAGLEQQILGFTFDKATNTTGWATVAQTILFIAIVFLMLRFFIMYIKRFLTIGLLILIAPLISISYVIDRAGDKKSQIFNTWGKELAVNIFIQPLHAIIYIVFIYSAGEIAKVAPLFAVLFIFALSRSEKIVKSLFNLRGLSTIHSMSETLKMKKLNSD